MTSARMVTIALLFLLDLVLHSVVIVFNVSVTNASFIVLFVYFCVVCDIVTYCLVTNMKYLYYKKTDMIEAGSPARRELFLSKRTYAANGMPIILSCLLQENLFPEGIILCYVWS